MTRLLGARARLPAGRGAGPRSLLHRLDSDGAARAGHEYTAIAKHPDEASAKRHEEMGFHDGWNTVVDQLAEYTKTV